MRIRRTLPPAAAPIFFKDIVSGLKGIMRGQKELDRFESEIKVYYKVKHCFLLSSGKAALTVILKALHRHSPEKDTVLIPAFTCFSVPSAIIRAGLKIKLCDMDSETLDFNFKELKLKLTDPSILAIIPTHLFGLPANIPKLKTVCTKNDVFLIEDAAQAMGGTDGNKKLGTIGDIGFFSLGRGKGFSTVEGGIIITNHDKIARQIKGIVDSLPDYSRFETLKLILFSIVLSVFMLPSFFWFPKSLPFLKLGETIFDTGFSIKRLTPFQAGLAKNWKNKLHWFSTIRQDNCEHWFGFFERRQKIGGKNPLFRFGAKKKILIRFPVYIDNSLTFKKVLKKSNQIGAGIMGTYPGSINTIKALKDCFAGQNYPVAESLAQKLVTLPVHPFVSAADQLKVIRLFNVEKESR